MVSPTVRPFGVYWALPNVAETKPTDTAQGVASLEAADPCGKERLMYQDGLRVLASRLDLLESDGFQDLRGIIEVARSEYRFALSVASAITGIPEDEMQRDVARELSRMRHSRPVATLGGGCGLQLRR